MKIKEISLNNFANYEKVSVSLDPDLNFIVGKNGSGKSTLGITGVQAIFQGIAEKATNGTTPVSGERFRFIGPAGATSKNYIILVDEKNGNAEIKISRKITKTGSELSIEAPETYGQLDQEWLNSLFNIFLISPKNFLSLPPKDQAKALGIDTKQYDIRIAELKKEYTETNAIYRSFGELPEVEAVERVDLTALQAQKDEIRKNLNEQYLANKALNDIARAEYEADLKAAKEEFDELCRDMDEKNKKRDQAKSYLEILVQYGYTGNEVQQWIDSLPFIREVKRREIIEPHYIQELPDDSALKAIDMQIVAAGETNNNALLYEQYLQKKEQKEAKETELKTNKEKQAKIEAERLEYIKGFKFPFSNLTVGEEGELLLNGKPIKAEYFSTGELLKIIPVLISTTQPELKYVFLQDFNLMDEDKQREIEEYLTGKGFQLVVEVVGKSKIADKNCILLRDNVVVENYEETKAPEIAL